MTEEATKRAKVQAAKETELTNAKRWLTFRRLELSDVKRQLRNIHDDLTVVKRDLTTRTTERDGNIVQVDVVRRWHDFAEAQL